MIISLHSDQISMVFPIGHAFTAEAKRPAPFNEAYFAEVWAAMLHYGLGEIYAVLEGGKAVAALGASFTREPFSGLSTASEMFWYVMPEHRSKGFARQLLDHFEAEAASRKCEQILMVGFASLDLTKLYERRGYVMLEQTFRKGI